MTSPQALAAHRSSAISPTSKHTFLSNRAAAHLDLDQSIGVHPSTPRGCRQLASMCACLRDQGPIAFTENATFPLCFECRAHRAFLRGGATALAELTVPIAKLAEAGTTRRTGLVSVMTFTTWKGDDVLSVPIGALFRKGEDWVVYAVERWPDTPSFGSAIATTARPKFCPAWQRAMSWSSIQTIALSDRATPLGSSPIFPQSDSGVLTSVLRNDSGLPAYYAACPGSPSSHQPSERRSGHGCPGQARCRLPRLRPWPRQLRAIIWDEASR